MAREVDPQTVDETVLTPYSKEWTSAYLNVLCNDDHSGQGMLSFYLKSFPDVDEKFLKSLEKAAADGDLDLFAKAAACGLPMDMLPQKPLINGLSTELSIVFSPLDKGIENGHQGFVEALATGTEFRKHVHTHCLSEDATDALVKGRQTRAIAAIYRSDLFTDKSLTSLTRKIVNSLDPALWDAAGTRFFDIKDESEPQHVTVLSMAILAGNESLFDACVHRSQRPWQQKVSGSEFTVTAFDRLCQGRNDVLTTYEGTKIDREDLARRVSIAHKLDLLGFGPELTSIQGSNAAHAAAVWRTPDLLDVFFSIKPDLNKPDKDGWHPLHSIASNISRATTSDVLESLVGVFRKNGADMDCRNFDGDNAAASATRNQFGAVLEAMVKGGVPLNSRNNFDQHAIEGIFKGGAFSKRAAFMACALRVGLDANTTLSTGKTLMETLLGKTKDWHETVDTIRAFKAKSSAMAMIDEIEKESKAVASVSPYA